MADLNAIQRFNLRKQALLQSQDDYDEGENRANKAFTSIENRIGNNRDELTKVYDDYASRAANSTTLSDYYANRLVVEKAATKLGKNTIFDQIGDFVQGVYTGATGGMAKILEGIRETGDAIGSIGNMNPSKLYKVATGKADAKTKIESGLTYLNARHAQFPENNDITELYNLVNNGFDKDPGEYEGVAQIYSLVNKINDFTNALDVSLFQNKYTQDEYEAQRLQQLKTNLSYESDLAKGIQTGGQILGEQVPGILVANAAGGIANNLRNAVGLSKLSTAGKVGALAMLGLEAKGGAYREAISEGANFSQANAYSDQAAMAEVLSEVFGGESVNAFLGLGINLTPAGKAVKDALDGLGIKNKWIRSIINVGGELTAEAWEEVFTGFVDPIFKEATYGKKVDWENMPRELLSEFIDSLIPTALMMGLGRPQINLYIDNATKDLNTRVLNSTDITDADKIKITAELNNLAKDAKRMIEDDFDGTLAKVESEFNQKVEANNALKKKALDLIDKVETNQNLTDEQKDRYNQRVLNNSGIINNTNRMTRQEATDLGKTSNVQYANTEQVNNTTTNEGVTVKQKLNGVQRAVKDLFDRVTGGQIVYTENPVGVYGFTNNDGNFYVDGNQNTINTMRAATHEIGHMATEKDSTLMDGFNKKARPTVQQINAYREAIGNPNMSPAEAKAEMLNDVIAYIATKQKNLSRFEDNTRNALEKIRELFFGTETSSRPSNYALDNADYQKIELYVSPEILNDAEFENKVVEALLSLKDGKQTQKVLDNGKKITKEASKTKETNKGAPKTDKEKAYAKIEEKYKKMRGGKSPEAIKKMIADELNLKYGGPKDNSSDANEVRRVYQDLKDHSGTLFSKRKTEPDNNTKYSTRADNQGRELTSEQVAKYRKSQARNTLKELLELYHTQTDLSGAPFNKFNPPRDSKYKFRGQTVIYTTSSKDVSDSYARVPSQIETAKKNRINSITAAKKFISENGQSWQYKFEKKGEEIHVWYDLYGNLRQCKDKNGEMHYTGGPEKVFKTEEDFKRNFVNWFLDNENVMSAEQKFWQYPMYMNVIKPYIRTAGGNLWTSVVANSMEEVERHAKTADLIFELSSGEKARDFEYAVSSPTTNMFEFVKKVFDTEKLFEQSLENDDREALRKAEDNHYKAVRDWYEHILEDLKAKEEKMPEGKTKEAFAYAYDWLKDHKDWFDMEVMMIFASDREPRYFKDVAFRMKNNVIDTMESENRLTKKETNDIVKDALRYNYEHDVAGLKTTARLTKEMYQTEMEQDFGSVLRNLKRKYNEDLQGQEFETQEEREEAREELAKKFADDVLKEIDKYEDLKEIHDHLQKHPETLVQFFSYAPENMPGQVRQSDENLKIMYERGIGSIFDKRTLGEEMAVENTQLVQDLQEFASGFYYDTTQEEILAVDGYDGVFIMDVLDYGKNMSEGEAHPADLYIAFDPRQVDLVDNKTPTNDPDMRYSTRKGESNTEKIINNQRNELVKQQDKADRLEAENKGLKKINKGIKSTGRTRIRELQRESDKMLKVGRNTELKLKGQLEREGKKYNRLSELAVDLKYETQLDKKAQTDGIKYGREYKNLFIGLRREGKSITEAYNFTKEIYEASQELNNSIDSSMKILNDIRKKKVYNKLPKELKAKIDSYEQIWAGSRKQADLMLARRILDSAAAKEYLGKVALSKGVRNKIMNLEGDDFEGKGTISLEPLFNGSIGLAKSFEQGLIELQDEIKEFQSINRQKERAIELSDDTANIQVAVENEAKKQEKSKLKGLKKNVLGTNKTLANTLMTLKTEIQALMGGNIHTPVMKIQDNLQKGETRKKQSITEVYRILNTFMEKSKGINRVIGTQTWNKSLENSLSNKAKFTDTGMSSTGDNGKSVDIKLPRHMMMSLAMHLANDDNMLHISGGIVGISTDENGNTRISPIKGMGVRIPDEALYRRGQIKDAYDAGVTVKLTQEQVEKIVDMLTPEELAFVDATKEVFKYTTSLINEVSNRIVGYDMATVENYFPIRVWDEGESGGAVLNAPFQKRYGDALAYMLSPGWLQERTTSTNPIYLENIADVMNRVVNNVTNFYGYAEALRDNHIILDSTMGNGTELKKSIDALSSSFMPNYTRLTRFITGQESLRDGRFRGLMAMNTLTFNVGTWLTQPMSFFNAMKYFSTKEFMTSINPINNNVKLNNMIRDYFKEIGIDSNEYSDYELARAFVAMATPNLDYRAIGYKTPAINQLFNKSLQQKIGAHGIELFDDIAVTALARMMAYSVSLDENIEFGSEKYFEELGNRLTEVLVETQPEFSQINRANMFRSASPILRTLSLFGTPANQMFNNFVQSAMQVRYESREGKISNEAKVSLAKSISGIIISSAMVGLVRALRDSIRDDEDKDDFRDRWFAQTIVALLGPTLILDDVAQFIMSTAKFGGMNSYDFNTPETTFMNGITNLAEKLMQLGKEDVSATKKTTDIIKAMGVITPIDTKSIVRVFEALMKFIAPDLYQAYALQNSSVAYKAWLKNTDTPTSEFYRAYTATRQGELDKLGYHKADKSKGIESNLKETRRKALRQTFDSEADVNKYMEILFNYKS